MRRWFDGHPGVARIEQSDHSAVMDGDGVRSQIITIARQLGAPGDGEVERSEWWVIDSKPGPQAQAHSRRGTSIDVHIDVTNGLDLG